VKFSLKICPTGGENLSKEYRGGHSLSFQILTTSHENQQ